MSLETIVRPFYDACLTVTPGEDPARVAAILGSLLADSFQSRNATENKSKAQLIGQIQFFWKLVPDLRWHIEEMLVVGNRVVVRSTASGTPKGDFMGVPTDGTRSFRILTIDIHTVVEGRVVEVHHVEDWASALRQLKA